MHARGVAIPSSRRVISPKRYQELIDKEARHWGSVGADPPYPQLWHDQQLFDMFFGPEYRRLLESAAHCGSRVLELGSGEGNLALDLARRKLHVDGIEISAERVKRARQNSRAQKLNRRVRFLVKDLNTVTLPKQRYSCVVAHDVLHHILNLDHLLDEVKKTLRPGGLVLVMDYAGMGKIRKLFAAALFALLPTYQPYKEKWHLRKRLRSFMASEKEKRNALTLGKNNELHPESPFEEISQSSILPAIEKRFHVERLATSYPFWFYLAPKVRIHPRFRFAFARSMKSLDDALISLNPSLGAYISLEARKT